MQSSLNIENNILSRREEYAKRRLDELSNALEKLSSATDVTNLCVYVTGSFGRLEASEYSDLDLFFVQTSDDPPAQIGRIDKTLLDADIIKLARELQFPEFSRDGQFLEVHQLESILKHLGGPKDDFRNFFTARLLLLLESRPIYGTSVYEQVLQSLVEAYYRDYQDHERDFRPVFLVNDIVRFWKTLCLNYEHRRNLPTNEEPLRAKSHLKNFKLKFSRMLTCYSALAWIASQDPGPEPNDVFEMVKLTPVQRIRAVAELNLEVMDCIQKALSHYSWFLQVVGRREAEVLEWIRVPANRDEAFTHGREFGQSIFELIVRLASDKPFLRYLVV